MNMARGSPRCFKSLVASKGLDMRVGSKLEEGELLIANFLKAK